MRTITKLLVGALFLLTACEKEAGEGGTSSIKGSVWVKNYNADFTNLKNEYPGIGEDVYIIYGDGISYGDRIETNHKGEYEFEYLNEGTYTVYVYSKDSAAVSACAGGCPGIADTVIVQQVEINSKRQVVEVPTFTVYN